MPSESVYFFRSISVNLTSVTINTETRKNLVVTSVRVVTVTVHRKRYTSSWEMILVTPTITTAAGPDRVTRARNSASITPPNSMLFCRETMNQRQKSALSIDPSVRKSLLVPHRHTCWLRISRLYQIGVRQRGTLIKGPQGKKNNMRVGRTLDASGCDKDNLLILWLAPPLSEELIPMVPIGSRAECDFAPLAKASISSLTQTDWSRVTSRCRLPMGKNCRYGGKLEIHQCILVFHPKQIKRLSGMTKL